MPGFESGGLKGGLWRGRLSGEQPPGRVVLVHHGEVVAEAQLRPEGENAWQVEVQLPGEVLSEGVQTLLLVADEGGEEPGAGLTLARLALMAGRPLDEDLLAEMAALRSELELVKRELRRIGAAQG